MAATVGSRESEAAPQGGTQGAPIALLTASPIQSVAPPTGTVAPGEALALLMAGNNKFQSADLPRVDAIEERRQMLLDGQAPHAVVLACSDSRVSPDLIFAQGLGDLFVVRVAGNFPDDLVLGSIEFAITELGARLVMVLGHEKCGAVTGGVRRPRDVEFFARAPSDVRTAVEPRVARERASRGDPGRSRSRERSRRRCRAALVVAGAGRRGRERPRPGCWRRVPARERCGYAGRLNE